MVDLRRPLPILVWRVFQARRAGCASRMIHQLQEAKTFAMGM